MNSPIIESANLKLETEQTGKVIFPSNIYNMGYEKYAGPLYGYYVSYNKIFNVIPTNPHYKIERDSRISLLGYVLPINPLKFIIEDRREQMPETAGLNDEYIYITRSSDDSISIENKLIHEMTNILGDIPMLLNPIIRFVEDVFEDSNKSCDLVCYRNDLLLAYWDGDDLLFNHMEIGRSLGQAWTKISKATLAQETYTLELDVFSMHTGILESDIMRTKGIILIGCGSVGSLFALDLARAGVGRFMLIDSGTVGYHDICRHLYGIFDVGKDKADAIEERILQINPYADISTFRGGIQEVPLNFLMDYCGSNTIIVSEGNDREVDLYANEIAQQAGIPFMSIGCCERTFAGEIFYCS